MTEYRVWCENGDLIDVCDDVDEALFTVDYWRNTCPCDGDQDCGVIYAHGIYMQIVEDGQEVYL